MKRNKNLPKFLQSFLPSYDISQMELDNLEDKQEIITQILNYGNKKDIIWLFRTYSLKEIRDVISHPMRGCWREKVLNYWTKFFNIKLPKIIYEVAIFSFQPRPKLAEQYFKMREKKEKKDKVSMKI